MGFRSWLQNKSEIFQIQFAMLVRALPYFMAFYMVMFYWAVTRPTFAGNQFEIMSQIFNIVTPGLGVAFIGGIIVEGYWNSVQRAAREHKGVVLTLWWTPTLAIDEQNVIEEINILREEVDKEYTFFVKKTNPSNIAIAGIKESIEEIKLKYGEFFYDIRMVREMDDPWGEKWSHAVLLSFFPAENAFRDVPEQFIISSGVYFIAPAAKLNLVYLNEFTEIDKNYKVFCVGFDPERVLAIQQKLGLKPPSVEKSDVVEAAQLSIDHSATRALIGQRQAESSLRTHIETFRDSRARGLSDAGRFIDNSDYIRRSKSRMTPLKNKGNLIKIAIIIGAIVFIAWRLGWIRF